MYRRRRRRRRRAAAADRAAAVFQPVVGPLRQRHVFASVVRPAAGPRRRGAADGPGAATEARGCGAAPGACAGPAVIIIMTIITIVTKNVILHKYEGVLRNSVLIHGCFTEKAELL